MKPSENSIFSPETSIFRKVEVLVFIDAKGNVTKASIHTSTNSALNSNALAAARKWKFSEHPELGSSLQKIIIPFIFTF